MLKLSLLIFTLAHCLRVRRNDHVGNSRLVISLWIPNDNWCLPHLKYQCKKLLLLFSDYSDYGDYGDFTQEIIFLSCKDIDCGSTALKVSKS